MVGAALSHAGVEAKALRVANVLGAEAEDEAGTEVVVAEPA